MKWHEAQIERHRVITQRPLNYHSVLHNVVCFIINMKEIYNRRRRIFSNCLFGVMMVGVNNAIHFNVRPTPETETWHGSP